jgi:hypothetical protein
MTDRTRPFALALVLVLLAAGVAPTTALAQSDSEDEDLSDAIFGAAVSAVEDPLGAASKFSAWGQGVAANVGAWAGDPDRTPSECASDLTTEYNEHNATYEEYVNSRTKAEETRDVVRIDCQQDEDGETTTETVYLVADVQDGNYTNSRIVDSTDRTVDERVLLTGVATEDAPDDLETFRTEYAADDETPPPAYRGRMTGKYWGNVYGSFGFLPHIEEA